MQHNKFQSADDEMKRNTLIAVTNETNDVDESDVVCNFWLKIFIPQLMIDLNRLESQVATTS